MRFLIRRVIAMFRRPSDKPDPQLLRTRSRLDAAEQRLAKKLNVSIEDLRSNYDLGDHVLGRR